MAAKISWHMERNYATVTLCGDSCRRVFTSIDGTSWQQMSSKSAILQSVRAGSPRRPNLFALLTPSGRASDVITRNRVRDSCCCCCCRCGKHDDIMRSGDGGRDGRRDGSGGGRQMRSESPGRRRRLLRDGSISCDRLNLDGRRNKIIDVFARRTHAITTTHAHTHTHATSTAFTQLAYSTAHELNWTKLIWNDLTQFSHDAFAGHARQRHDCSSYWLAVAKLGRSVLG